MAGCIEEFLKFITEFTWKKFFALAGTILVSFVIFSLYESYTSSFRFGRLQKAADLLVQVQQIETAGTNSTPELRRAQAALVAQTVEAIDAKPLSLKFVPATLTFSADRLLKFCAAIVWFFCGALLQLRTARQNKENTKQALSGLFLIALITGTVGMFVPAIWWPWFHIFFFPLIFVLCAFVILLPFGFATARRTALKNVCISNLKQIDGAKEQWALENKRATGDSVTWDDLYPYVRTTPKCPKGGTYKLGVIGENPVCSHDTLGHRLPD